MNYGHSSMGKSAASITQLYPAPLRTRPCQVTNPITEVILEAAYHCAHHYEEVLAKLAVYGMWISRETFQLYKRAYHVSLKDCGIL